MTRLVIVVHWPTHRTGKCIIHFQGAARVRQFILKNCPSRFGVSDQIHDQIYFLNYELRRKLFEQHGVSSYSIYQNAGEAMFVPAGCAHQVCNLDPAIKVAMDFACLELTDERLPCICSSASWTRIMGEGSISSRPKRFFI